MKNLVKDSPWLGQWVRFHHRDGQMVIASVEYVKSDGAGNIDTLFTSLGAIIVNKVLESRLPDNFDLETEKRKVATEVARRFVKMLEDYRGDLNLKEDPGSPRGPADAVLIPLIEQVTMEDLTLRGETNV